MPSPNYLRAARYAMNLTQADVADLLGVSEQTYQHRETDPYSLSVYELRLLIKRLPEMKEILLRLATE